jgi:hypothetical protein
MEADKSEILEELTPQDRDWLPKLTAEVQLPPIAPPGEYKIMVKVQDAISQAEMEAPVSFQVRGRDVPASATLVIRNFDFYRSEDDAQPMERALYHNGSPLVVKFDVTGYKYGANNKIDVSYKASILDMAGHVLWTQPDPAVEQSEAFYPQPYVPEFMQLDLQKVNPGAYTVLIQVKDAVGNQSAEARRTFSVQ